MSPEAPNPIRKMLVTEESLLTLVKLLYVTQDSSTVVVYNFTRYLWFMVYRTGNITFVACLLWFMAYKEYYCWSVLVSLYRLCSLYNDELIRSVSIKHTDRYDSHGSYGAYEPTTHCALMS